MKNLNKFVLLVLLSSTQSTNTIGLLGFITSPNFQAGATTLTTGILNGISITGFAISAALTQQKIRYYFVGKDIVDQNSKDIDFADRSSTFAETVTNAVKYDHLLSALTSGAVLGLTTATAARLGYNPVESQQLIIPMIVTTVAVAGATYGIRKITSTSITTASNKDMFDLTNKWSKYFGITAGAGLIGYTLWKRFN